MKHIKFLYLMLIALLSFNACEMDDDVVFKASTDDSIAFTNTF